MVVLIIVLVLTVIVVIVVPFLIIRTNNAKFSKESLHPEEEIQTIAITHWFVTLKIIVLQLLITGLCVTMLLSMLSIAPFILLLLLVLLWINVSYKSREFVVTNKRIIIKYGIISRKTKEYRYEKIESCNVSQSAFGRILQYGSIIILGVGGSGNKERYVQDPFAFRQFIIDKIDCGKEITDSSIKGTQLGTDQIGTITELKEYKKLLEEGVLTPEEFENKKREILNR